MNAGVWAAAGGEAMSAMRLLVGALREESTEADMAPSATIQDLRAIADAPRRGELPVRVSIDSSASRLPDLLSRFHSSFPDVRVELRTGTNDALTAAVAARQLDALLAQRAVDLGDLRADEAAVVVGPVPRDVRRRHDRVDAAVDGGAGQTEGVLHRLRPVVDAGEDVAVEVDHLVLRLPGRF